MQLCLCYNYSFKYILRFRTAKVSLLALYKSNKLRIEIDYSSIFGTTKFSLNMNIKQIEKKMKELLSKFSE